MNSKVTPLFKELSKEPSFHNHGMWQTELRLQKKNITKIRSRAMRVTFLIK